MNRTLVLNNLYFYEHPYHLQIEMCEGDQYGLFMRSIEELSLEQIKKLSKFLQEISTQLENNLRIKTKNKQLLQEISTHD